MKDDPTSLPEAFEDLWQILLEQVAQAQPLAITLSEVAVACLAIAAAFAVTRLASPAQAFLLRRGTKTATGLVRVIPLLALLIWVVCGVAALVVLSDAFAHISGLLWLAGAAALLVGLRDVLRQSISGVFVILQGRVRPGEYVQIGALRGRIERLGLMRVHIQTLDGLEHIVPPSALLTQTIALEPLPAARPVSLQVEVPAGLDPQRAARLLYEVAVLSPYADVRTRPEVAIETDGKSVHLSLWARSTSPRHERRYRTQVSVRIRRELEKLVAA
jgi:small-conductance mechanosensitive channel